MPTKPLLKGKPNPWLTDLPPLGMSSEQLARDIRQHFNCTLGRDKYCKSAHYSYTAMALAVRDRLMERWKNTHYAYEEVDCKNAYYLSMEFLMGRTLGNAMLNLGLTRSPAQGHARHRAGVGGTGGKRAGCRAWATAAWGGWRPAFIDSCATLQLPVMGYGLRYEYGMFRQHIEDGYQVGGARSLAAQRPRLGVGTSGVDRAGPFRRANRSLSGA